jgi:predicted permease
MADVYSVLNFIAFNIPLSTVAIYLTSKEKQVKKILMDVAKIPIFYSIIFALLVSYFSIPIPKSINNCIKLVGPAAIPLLIFILGLQLSNIRIKQGFIALLIPGIIIRLIISPLVALGVLVLLGVSGLEMRVAIVQTSAPAALLPLLYAIRFKRSPEFLATIIMITTILSGVTLTLLMRILG